MDEQRINPKFLDSLYINFFSIVNFCIKYHIHVFFKVKIVEVSDPQLTKKVHLKGIYIVYIIYMYIYKLYINFIYILFEKRYSIATMTVGIARKMAKKFSFSFLFSSNQCILKKHLQTYQQKTICY